MGLSGICVFQQDNDPWYSSVNARHWILSNTPKYEKTPPQSPDLNPIEHRLEELDRRIRARPISSIRDLRKALAEEWVNIQYSSKSMQLLTWSYSIHPTHRVVFECFRIESYISFPSLIKMLNLDSRKYLQLKNLKFKTIKKFRTKSATIIQNNQLARIFIFFFFSTSVIFKSPGYLYTHDDEYNRE